MNKKIDILDCTLRDGSYLIDYQFTAEDTYIICNGLEQAGFEMIEIGHGTGLGSNRVGKGRAAEPDEAYLEAAQTALSGTSARFGMFFIPGIGQMDDLALAAKYGMGFVRVGTNVSEIDEAERYIKTAKDLGMIVSSNLMKSYAVTIGEFIQFAKKADGFGADIICVVDSAGGMMPDDVSTYVKELQKESDRKIGYHGHNNLQLAVANTLEAVKHGATVVDASLQGMGRSAGNAQTEILIFALDKLGYQTGIDAYRSLDMGERIIKPMMSTSQGVDDISIVSGIAQFHSSFSKIIGDAALEYKIDPRLLIMEVSDIDRINVTPELASETAKKIKAHFDSEVKRRTPSIHTTYLDRSKPKDTVKAATEIINEMMSRSKKSGKEFVFTLTLSDGVHTSFPFLRDNASMIIGNCEAKSLSEIESVIRAIDGRVDWILMDESSPQLFSSKLEEIIVKSDFSWYSETRILRLALCAFLSQQRPLGRVLLFCDNENGSMIAGSLIQHSFDVIQYTTIKNTDSAPKLVDLVSDVDAIVSYGQHFSIDLTYDHVKYLNPDSLIILAKPDAYPLSFFYEAKTKGLRRYRIDSRCGFSAELTLVIETSKLKKATGISQIGDIPVVSGGVVASKGTVIVDSITDPTQVIGVTDGAGGLLSCETDEYKDVMLEVRAMLIEDRYQKKF